MEATEALATDPVDDAAASSADPSEASASTDASTAQEADHSAVMNALLKGHLPQAHGSTSNPDDDDDDDPAESQDGASASQEEGVKPSGQPDRPLGRRAAAAEIKRLNDEVRRLSEAYDQLKPPPPPDASDEARNAAVEREDRYRRLLVKPDSDPDWTSDDWDFLQKEKAERASNPRWEQHYQTVTADMERRYRGAYDSWVDGFRKHLLADMATAKDVPGVDFEAVKAAKTFAERDRLMHAAGRATNEPELKRLRDENAELRRDLLGSTRAPLNGGRSSPGRAVDENTLMNTLLRGGRV